MVKGYPYGHINFQVLHGVHVNKTGSFSLRAALRQREAGVGSRELVYLKIERDPRECGRRTDTAFGAD